MRRIVSALAATVTVLVLLFSYSTSTNSPATPGIVAARAGTAPALTAPALTAPATTAPPSGAASPPPVAASLTYTGQTAQTRWGPVQVAITVAQRTITAVDAVQVPDGNRRDVEINAMAVPILNAAALTAQSARIDTVSGATVTSEGYLQSLQSAIDQANL